MKKVKLSLEIAKEMFNSSEPSIREFAILNYPELNAKITDRVKTFEDACKIKGIDPNSDFFTNSILENHEIARRKIQTIIEVLNEGWKPNWDNSSETKYYPWFKWSSSGVGFSYHVYGYADTGTDVGSRQVLKTKELAVYVGKQFESIYNTMLNF